MKRIINIEPRSSVRWFLVLVPFALAIAAYIMTSDARLAINSARLGRAAGALRLCRLRQRVVQRKRSISPVSIVAS